MGESVRFYNETVAKYTEVSTSNPLPVTGGGGGGGSIDITTLAKEGKQDTGNTSLSSIDGKIPVLGQALVTASQPVVLPATQETTLRSITAVVPGVAATSLGKAEDAVAANGDTGIATFGVRGPVTPVAATSAAGDYGTIKLDAEGNQIGKLHAIPENTWQGIASVTTAATSVPVKAAGAAGVRNYLTDITVSNATAAGTLVTILDGTTVIWQSWVAAGLSVVVSFVTPLRGTAATALNVQSSVAMTTLYVAASGFIGV